MSTNPERSRASTTFPPALFRFLVDLADNNDRDWFNANKARYQADVVEPTLAFIEALAPALQQLSPRFLAIAKKQGGSMFRIHRDVRFSQDKSPYKTHVAMHFRHEAATRDVHAPGFYLHLAPGDVMVGAGMWQPDPASLRRIRDRIVADAEGWRTVRSALGGTGLTFFGESLKRAPKGFDPDHEHIEDLRRKSFAVSGGLDETALVDGDPVKRVIDEYAKARPLVAFLCASQGLPID